MSSFTLSKFFILQENSRYGFNILQFFKLIMKFDKPYTILKVPVHNCVTRHFHIPEPWRFIVVIFYNRDTGRFIEHTMQHIWINKISLRLSQTNMCSPLELLLLHLDSLLMQQHYLLSSMGRFYLMKDSASLCMF